MSFNESIKEIPEKEKEIPEKEKEKEIPEKEKEKETILVYHKDEGVTDCKLSDISQIRMGRIILNVLAPQYIHRQTIPRIHHTLKQNQVSGVGQPFHLNRVMDCIVEIVGVNRT